jgi:hypothetical protein
MMLHSHKLRVNQLHAAIGALYRYDYAHESATPIAIDDLL